MKRQNNLKFQNVFKFTSLILVFIILFSLNLIFLYNINNRVEDIKIIYGQKKDFYYDITTIDIPELFGTDQNLIGNENQQENNLNNETNNQNDYENDEEDENYDNNQNYNFLEDIDLDETKSELLNKKNTVQKEFSKYKREYNNSTTNALVAIILDKLRIISIPIFILIMIGTIIYQYIVGARKKDFYAKGHTIRKLAIGGLLIVQILPFIFALIVKGWGK